MKKIITAIGNQELNKRLCSFENLLVKERDIFYKEGVLEVLEEKDDIDILIFNENLCEKNELIEFLKKINFYKVQIYLILNNSDEYSKSEFEKIENLKIYFSEEDIIKSFEGNQKYYENETYKLNDKIRIFSIVGTYNSGKTIISSLLAKELSKKKKVLIIDFDILNNSLKALFDIRKTVKYRDIYSLIYKVNKNLSILTDIKYIFNETNRIDYYKVKELIEYLKSDFEYIIIDTSSEINLKYIKTIFPNVDYNIFLLEGNFIEVKKAKELLEIYLMDYELDVSKIGIVINKVNINSIDLEILKNVFENIKILGRIKYNLNFNSYINKHTNEYIKLKEIEAILRKIEKRGKNE